MPPFSFASARTSIPTPKRLLQPCRAALAFLEPPKRVAEIVLRLRLDQRPRPRIKDAHHCCNVAQEPAPTTPSSRRVWRLAGGWNPSKNSVSVSPWPGCPSISHTEQFPGFRCCPYHFSAEIRKQEPG